MAQVTLDMSTSKPLTESEPVTLDMSTSKPVAGNKPVTLDLSTSKPIRHLDRDTQAAVDRNRVHPEASVYAAPSTWKSFMGAVLHPINYLSDVEQDVTEGGGRTIVGRGLGHMQHGSMEDTGYTVDHTAVAPILAGPVQGIPKVLRGVARMGEAVLPDLLPRNTPLKERFSEGVSGLNEATSGAMQVAPIVAPEMLAAPTLLPRVVAGTLASKAAQTGLGYIGVPDEYSELGGNIAGGVAAAGPELLDVPAVKKAVTAPARGAVSMYGAVRSPARGEILESTRNVGLSQEEGTLATAKRTAKAAQKEYDRALDQSTSHFATNLEDVPTDIRKRLDKAQDNWVRSQHNLHEATLNAEAAKHPNTTSQDQPITEGDVRAARKPVVPAESAPYSTLKFGMKEPAPTTEPTPSTPPSPLGRVGGQPEVPQTAPAQAAPAQTWKEFMSEGMKQGKSHAELGAEWQKLKASAQAEAPAAPAEAPAAPSLKNLQKSVGEGLGASKTRLENEGTRSGVIGHETHTNADTTEFHAEDKNGTVHVFNVEGGPEQAKTLEGMSWQSIKNEPGVTHVAKISKEGLRTPDRPSVKDIVTGERGEAGLPGTIHEETPSRPEYSQTSDENSTTHTVRFGNAKVEAVEFKGQPGVLHITGAEGDVNQAGSGFTAYERLAKEAAKQGKELRSGGSVGDTAKRQVANVWSKLKQVGFNVVDDGNGNFHIAKPSSALGKVRGEEGYYAGQRAAARPQVPAEMTEQRLRSEQAIEAARQRGPVASTKGGPEERARDNQYRNLTPEAQQALAAKGAGGGSDAKLRPFGQKSAERAEGGPRNLNEKILGAKDVVEP